MDEGGDLGGIIRQEGIAVLGGDGDEIADTLVGLHEAGLEVGEELGVSLGIQGGDIVQENGEITAAQLVDLLALGHELLKVGLVAAAQVDVPAGGDGVDELDVVLIRRGDEVSHALQLCTRVAGTPLGTVLGIVLGGVNVGVHLVLAHEGEEILAVLMSPGGAVEALDDTAQGVARSVLHRNGRAFSLLGELKEGHDGIVEASLGLRHDLDLLGADREDVALVGTVRELGKVTKLNRYGHAALGLLALGGQKLGVAREGFIQSDPGKIRVGVTGCDLHRSGIHVGDYDFRRLGLLGLGVGVGIGVG